MGGAEALVVSRASGLGRIAEVEYALLLLTDELLGSMANVPRFSAPRDGTELREAMPSVAGVWGASVCM